MDRPGPPEFLDPQADQAADDLQFALDQDRIVRAAVCQPLATSPPKKLARAASSSRWNGWGSNSAANALTRSGLNRDGSGPERLPDGEVLEIHRCSHCYHLLGTTRVGRFAASRFLMQ